MLGYTYRGYHIMTWRNSSEILSYSAYGRNMYEVKDGFKTIQEAKAWIDGRLS